MDGIFQQFLDYILYKSDSFSKSNRLFDDEITLILRLAGQEEARIGILSDDNNSSGRSTQSILQHAKVKYAQEGITSYNIPFILNTSPKGVHWVYGLFIVDLNNSSIRVEYRESKLLVLENIETIITKIIEDSYPEIQNRTISFSSERRQIDYWTCGYRALRGLLLQVAGESNPVLNKITSITETHDLTAEIYGLILSNTGVTPNFLMSETWLLANSETPVNNRFQLKRAVVDCFLEDPNKFRTDLTVAAIAEINSILADSNSNAVIINTVINRVNQIFDSNPSLIKEKGADINRAIATAVGNLKLILPYLTNDYATQLFNLFDRDNKTILHYLTENIDAVNKDAVQAILAVIGAEVYKIHNLSPFSEPARELIKEQIFYMFDMAIDSLNHENTMLAPYLITSVKKYPEIFIEKLLDKHPNNHALLKKIFEEGNDLNTTLNPEKFLQKNRARFFNKALALIMVKLPAHLQNVIDHLALTSTPSTLHLSCGVTNAA